MMLYGLQKAIKDSFYFWQCYETCWHHLSSIKLGANGIPRSKQCTVSCDQWHGIRGWGNWFGLYFARGRWKGCVSACITLSPASQTLLITALINEYAQPYPPPITLKSPRLVFTIQSIWMAGAVLTRAKWYLQIKFVGEGCSRQPPQKHYISERVETQYIYSWWEKIVLFHVTCVDMIWLTVRHK